MPLTGPVPAAGLDAAPGGGQAARRGSFSPPSSSQYWLLQVTLLLDRHLLWEHTQTPSLQRAMLTAALAAPSPPPASLLPSAPARPAKLCMQLLSIRSWSTWASIAACYLSWRRQLPEGELGKDHVGLEGPEGKATEAVPREIVTRSWMMSFLASTAETGTEERNCPWTLSWHHQPQPRVFHGQRKSHYFLTLKGQTQELKTQSFLFILVLILVDL